MQVISIYVSIDPQSKMDSVTNLWQNDKYNFRVPSKSLIPTIIIVFNFMIALLSSNETNNFACPFFLYKFNTVCKKNFVILVVVVVPFLVSMHSFCVICFSIHVSSPVPTSYIGGLLIMLRFTHTYTHALLILLFNMILLPLATLMLQFGPHCHVRGK